MIPRIIRLRDAPRYLGMDKNRFNRLVRPFVPEKRYGPQSVAFDRLDLDAWADKLFSAAGLSEEEEWKGQNSLKGLRGGKTRKGDITRISTSRNTTGEGAFAGLAKQVIREKQRGD